MSAHTNYTINKDGQIILPRAIWAVVHYSKKFDIEYYDTSKGSENITIKILKIDYHRGKDVMVYEWELIDTLYEQGRKQHITHEGKVDEFLKRLFGIATSTGEEKAHKHSYPGTITGKDAKIIVDYCEDKNSKISWIQDGKYYRFDMGNNKVSTNKEHLNFHIYLYEPQDQNDIELRCYYQTKEFYEKILLAK